MSRWLKSSLFAAGLAACGAPTHEVASHYVKSQLISASKGGTITVGQADDPVLAGTSIVIPAGALPADTTVTIAEGATRVAPAGAQTAGPVATFGPDGTKFSTPATITLPYALPAGAAVGDLEIEAVESSGAATTLSPSQLKLNAKASTAAFGLTGFPRHGAFVGPAGDGGVDGGTCPGFCPSGQACCASARGCTDLSTDENNCGACGNVCPSSSTCSGGACITIGPCQGCATCRTDADCTGGTVCVNGSCSSAIDGGVNACVAACGVGCAPPGSYCFSDGQFYCSPCVAACHGASQVACADGGISTVGDGGTCPGFCPSGQVCCDPTTGCTDLSTDPNNCGTCGNACPSGSQCTGGACTSVGATDGGSGCGACGSATYCYVIWSGGAPPNCVATDSCNALPAACDTSPTCACLLDAGAYYPARGDSCAVDGGGPVVTSGALGC